MLVRHLNNEERVDGGIVLPDRAHRTHCKSVVVAIGADIERSWLNSVVLTANYSSPDFMHEGQPYTFIREKDVHAIFSDADVSMHALPLA